VIEPRDAGSGYPLAPVREATHDDPAPDARTRLRWPLSGRATLHVGVTVLYAVAMAAFYGAGATFGVNYDWQHFHDVALLRERLWESLFYTHAFTPFINLVVGAVFWIAPNHADAVHHGLFLVLGAVLVNALAALFEVFAIPRWVNVLLVAAFVASPAFLYLGSFLHYEFPTTALLMLAAVLLHRAAIHGSRFWWLLFFLDAALITYVRTSFHLVWFGSLIVLALLVRPRQWKLVGGTALVPLALVAALYFKNLAVFGFFGTSSWFGFNVAIVTTERLPKAERKAWIEDGVLHPVSGVSLYAGPRAYRRLVDITHKTGIPVLDRHLRSNGLPNYNHNAYLEISRLRMAGNRAYLERRKRDYWRTVGRGHVDYFRPTSRWHPQDPKGSPHAENRRLVEPWENLYNRVVHGFPLPPFGLYVGLIAAIVARLAFSLWAIGRSRQVTAPDAVVLFMAMNCVYVPLLSCLVTIGELERYRFMVEGFMWVLAASGIAELVRASARAFGRGSPAA